MEKKEDNKSTDSSNQILHDFKDMNQATFLSTRFLLMVIVVVLLGIGSGYAISRSKNGGKMTAVQQGSTPSANSGATFGSTDTTTFKDTAQGVLQQGGIDGEGQYHLVRPGGDSQNVYLTSSLVDLSQFNGKKVEVWGQTQKAQKAGWLMDVGRVKVLE